MGIATHCVIAGGTPLAFSCSPFICFFVVVPVCCVVLCCVVSVLCVPVRGLSIYEFDKQQSKNLGHALDKELAFLKDVLLSY